MPYTDENELFCNENLNFEEIDLNEQIISSNTYDRLIENKIDNTKNNIDYYDYDLDENMNKEELNYYLNRTSKPILLQQKFINSCMRAILIDWLMELCAQFEFKRSTFHLSINILDQYLTKTSDLPTDKFQLIGVTSLIISAKMEVFFRLSHIQEILMPLLNNFSYATAKTYSEQDIIQCEKYMLKVNYLVNFPL
jgi:hypothetical protein